MEPITDWYDRRDELEQGQVFRCHDGSLVKLDHRLAGDGTDWVVATEYNGKWYYYENRIHPGDLAEMIDVETA